MFMLLGRAGIGEGDMLHFRGDKKAEDEDAAAEETGGSGVAI